jgi:hypothetical protein
MQLLQKWVDICAYVYIYIYTHIYVCNIYVYIYCTRNIAHHIFSLSSLLSKSVKIKIYRIIFCVLFYTGVKLGRSQ